MSLAILLFACQAAAGDGPIVLVAERSVATGIEQNALVLDAGEARFTRNANFLDLRWPPRSGAKPVRIGSFRSPLTDPLKIRRSYWTNVHARLSRPVSGAPPRGQLPNPGGPHGVRILLNGFELRPTSEEFEEAMDLLNRAEKIAKWEALDAVAVSVAASGGIELTHEGKSSGKETLPRERCYAQGKLRLSCPAGRLGRAYINVR